MPITVPVQQVQDQPIQLPGAAALSDSGLGTTAKGLASATADFAKAEVDAQKRRDATQVLTAVSALGDAEREMRRTNEARTGSRAYGVTDDTASWWDEHPAKIEAELENEVQREMYAHEVMRRREISLNSFSAFEARESRQSTNDATDATIVNSINEGAAGYDNPEQVKKSHDDIISMVNTRAAFNNMTPEARDQLAEEMLTKLHVNVIENMAEDDPVAANKYFIANKHEIAGSAQDGIRNKINGARDLDAAQRSADEIYARYPNDEIAALAAARKENTGQQREHALSLLRQQYADQEQAVARADKAGLESARSSFNTVDPDTGKPAGIRGLTSGQIDLLERKYPGELRAMRSTTPQAQVQTNWDVYYGALDMAKKDPLSFRDDFDADLLRADLNEVELNGLKKMQEDMKKGIPPGALTVNQIIASYMPEKDGEANIDKERRGLFTREAGRQIDAETNRLGHKLSQEEMTGIIDKLLINTTIDSPWYWANSTKPRFAMTPADYQAAWNNLDADDRAAIEADFREKGDITNPALTLGDIARMIDWYSTATQE